MFSSNFSTAKMTVQYGCPVQVKETISIRWNLNLYLIFSFCFGGSTFKMALQFHPNFAYEAHFAKMLCDVAHSRK